MSTGYYRENPRLSYPHRVQVERLQGFGSIRWTGSRERYERRASAGGHYSQRSFWELQIVDSKRKAGEAENFAGSMTLLGRDGINHPR